MNTNALQKALEASKRLGIPCVIVIEDTPVVMMDVEAYEQMKNGYAQPISNHVETRENTECVRGLTEEELFDKINHDIASWRSANQTEESVVAPETQEQASEVKPVNTMEEHGVEEQFYIEPVE